MSEVKFVHPISDEEFASKTLLAEQLCKDYLKHDTDIYNLVNKKDAIIIALDALVEESGKKRGACHVSGITVKATVTRKENVSYPKSFIDDLIERHPFLKQYFSIAYTENSGVSKTLENIENLGGIEKVVTSNLPPDSVKELQVVHELAKHRVIKPGKPAVEVKRI